MAATTLTERHAPDLHGVSSCHDRLIVTGTLPGACYAGGMTSFLYSRGIRVFDYPKFAEPLRERIPELIALVSKHFEVPKSAVTIKSGAGARIKLVAIVIGFHRAMLPTSCSAQSAACGSALSDSKKPRRVCANSNSNFSAGFACRAA